MATEEKDLKKKSAENNSTVKESSDKNAKSKPPKDKVIKDAEKALKPKEESKIDKKQKEQEESGLSSYETQALQGVTKSKGNKKLLIIILLLIGLIGAGVGVALFFILQPKDEKPVEAIVCEVEVISYYVENNDQIVIGDSDKFSFTEETQETSNFTKDLEGQITEIRDIAMVYLVNNTTQNNYVYRFDFSELVIQNCNVTVKINGGETYAINDARRYVSVTQAGDIVLEIKISLAEIPDYEEIQTWIENTKCEGPISLTLSLE